MPPNAALTLGLVADPNVLVFCQLPREPSLIWLTLHWYIGKASVHPPPAMLGFISFSPTGLGMVALGENLHRQVRHR